jgi:hypothetical protein
MRPDLQELVITEEYLTNLIGENPDRVRYFFAVEKPKEPGDFLIKLGISIILWVNFKSVRRLVKEVDRYNAVIKAVNINDQLEEADLVRALKTERILRENKKFIAKNPQLFTTNLTALTALQVSDQASEYGRVLDQALQIAVGVQEEMRKLQNRR